MTTKPDTDIDTGDIPEARHAGRGVRGKYYEQATGRPLPQAVRLLNKAEAEVRRLRQENQRLRAALGHYAEGYPGGIGDTAREALQEAPVASGSDTNKRRES